MIIKTFVGESSAAVLKQVRTELGGDAVVLTTRRVANGMGGYNTEITACLDAPAPVGKVATTPHIVGSSRKVTTPSWNRIARPGSAPVVKPAITKTQNHSTVAPSVANTELSTGLVAQLRDLDLPENLISSFIASVTAGTPVADLLRAEAGLRLAALPQLQTGDRLLVIGPAGSGKTTVVAKLAAQLVGQGKLVTVTGSHQQKIGAIDELQNIADLIGVECPAEFETEPANTDTITLIDCGTCQLSADEVSLLNPTHALFVFAATSRTSDLLVMAGSLSGISVTGLVMTMLDQTYRLGSLFAVSDLLAVPVMLVSHSAIGPNSLVAPVDSLLAAQMLSKGNTNAR